MKTGTGSWAFSPWRRKTALRKPNRSLPVPKWGGETQPGQLTQAEQRVITYDVMLRNKS